MIRLRKKEEIRLVKRRHHLILIRNILGITLVFAALVVLMGVAFFASIDFPESLVEIFPFLLNYKTRVLILYFLSLSLLILWQAGFVVVATYYLDCWIVTDERTIHTELRALFNRILSSVPHHRVQDITVEVHGVFPTLLRYGNLQIQTAGRFHEFIFKQIPEPYETKEAIFKAQKRYFGKMRKRGLSSEKMLEETAMPIVDDELPDNETD